MNTPKWEEELHIKPQHLRITLNVKKLRDVVHLIEQEARDDERGKNQLALAEAQFLGFIHGRDGYDIKSLVSAMGLTTNEWKSLLKEYSLSYLSEADIKDIEVEARIGSKSEGVN